REVAGGIAVFGAYSPTAVATRTPGFEAELSHELRRQSARFVLADPLRVEDEGQRSPRRTQAHVVAGHLVARLLFGRSGRIDLVVVAHDHVDEGAPIAWPVPAAPLRGP